MRITLRKSGGGQLEASIDLTGSESRDLARTLDDLDGKPLEIHVNRPSEFHSEATQQIVNTQKVVLAVLALAAADAFGLIVIWFNR